MQNKMENKMFYFDISMSCCKYKVVALCMEKLILVFSVM